MTKTKQSTIAVPITSPLLREAKQMARELQRRSTAGSKVSIHAALLVAVRAYMKIDIVGMQCKIKSVQPSTKGKK